MITEHDLREAIAECEGQLNPNANTCIKLSAFYNILEHLYGKNKTEPISDGYSFSSSSQNDITIKYSNSEFSQIVEEKGIENCFGIIDELMGTLYVINPSLYKSVIRMLTDL